MWSTHIRSTHREPAGGLWRQQGHPYHADAFGLSRSRAVSSTRIRVLPESWRGLWRPHGQIHLKIWPAHFLIVRIGVQSREERAGRG